MKTIPKLDGFEYTKVEPFTDNQKSLAIQALGYALGELGLWKDDLKSTDVIGTFVNYIDRGEIL